MSKDIRYEPLDEIPEAGKDINEPVRFIPRVATLEGRCAVCGERKKRNEYRDGSYTVECECGIADYPAPELMCDGGEKYNAFAEVAKMIGKQIKEGSNCTHAWSYEDEKTQTCLKCGRIEPK